MVKRLHLLIIFLLVTLISYAQEGNIYLKQYTDYLEGVDNQNWAIKQGANGFMYFGNTKGVLIYDGVKWKLIHTPSPVLSLGADTISGVIFVGCRNNFGYLQTDIKGNQKYISISGKRNGFGDITKIIPLHDHVYFYNSQHIFKVVKDNFFIEHTFEANAKKSFAGEIVHNGELFVNIKGMGLYRVEGSQLFATKRNNEIFEKEEILFSFQFDNNSTLFGTSNNTMFLFGKNSITPYKIHDEKYLTQNLLSDGVGLSNGQMALATLTGGCLIVDKASGKTAFQINYDSGLPDDEIFAIEKDNTGGLWMSHIYGLTRADNSLPFREYSTYPGMDGYLTTNLIYKNTLYAASSEGVYYLSDVKNYQEMEVVSVKKKVLPKKQEEKTAVKEAVAVVVPDQDVVEEDHEKIRKRAARKNKDKHEDGSDDTDGKKKRGLFARIFTKEDSPRRHRKDSIRAAEKMAVTLPSETVQQTTTSTRKRVYHLTSLQYLYKKVEGISQKCVVLAEYKDHLIAGTIGGIYDIVNKKAIAILPTGYINCIQPSASGDKLYVGTKAGLVILRLDKSNRWVIQRAGYTTENINSVCEDNQNLLWLGCRGRILKFHLSTDSTLTAPKFFYFDNQNTGNIVVRKIFGQAAIFLSSGIYHYNTTKDNIEIYPELTSFKNNYTFIASQPGITWVKLNSKWVGLDANSSEKNIEVPYLSLLKKINNIYVENNKDIWIVDHNNSLYKIPNAKILRASQKFNIQIREITDEKGMSLALQNLNLEYNNNSLNFQFASAHYTDESSIQYQYFLEGVMQDWSEWGNHSSIKFPYLPSGTYTLHARARNALGQISEVKKFYFEVLSPYWRRTWFYVLEIIVLSSLVVLSVVLNFNYKNHVVSRALTFLTLLIIVEFIATSIESAVNIGSDNPLIRLALNVMLALFINPIERLLHSIISKRRSGILRILYLFIKPFQKKTVKPKPVRVEA